MVGIYALWFEKSSMVYIGQSTNIEQRYKEHISSLKNNKHTNYKVQNEYNKYGIFELVVIQECLVDDLYSLEIQWTEEFNSLVVGLNIVEPGLSNSVMGLNMLDLNIQKSKY